MEFNLLYDTQILLWVSVSVISIKKTQKNIYKILSLSVNNQKLDERLKKCRLIDKQQIEIINILGNGAFGQVFKAKYSKNKYKTLIVAVKVRA